MTIKNLVGDMMIMVKIQNLYKSEIKASDEKITHKTMSGDCEVEFFQ